MSTKLAVVDVLKIKVFCSKGYDVVNFVHDITNNILSRKYYRCAHVTKV